MAISIYYDGNIIYPTPFITQDIKFVDYNGFRAGNIQEITLNGVISGINSTGNILQLTNLFSSQFGTMQVYQTNPSGLIYNWANIIIDEISFPQSHYYSGIAVPYTIKCHTYNVLSGVMDESNEYSFVQNEDGTVDVSHKISARGIRNSNSAFNNAVSFVKNFTGKNPLQSCATSFVPSGSGILMSLSEKIDRPNGVYSVIEQYKYTTGFSSIYTQVSNLDIDDSLDQTYLILNYDVKFKGSPVYNNMLALNTAVAAFYEQNDLITFGISTGLLIQTSSEITRNSGAAEIDIKYSYYSGYNNLDLTGFFDYDVTLKKDFITPKETWEINGEYICRGPIVYKYQQLNAFKQSISGDYRGWLLGLISGSPIFSGFHTSGNYLSSNPVLTITENTGMVIFQASLSVDDGGQPIGLTNTKYNVEIQPQLWQYELLPSANIEGLYIIQDLQMRKQNRTNLSLSSISEFAASGLPVLSGYLNQLVNIYINSGFLIESQYVTGINDLSCENHWIGSSLYDTGLLNIKMAGSNNFAFTRVSGYDFGY